MKKIYSSRHYPPADIPREKDAEFRSRLSLDELWQIAIYVVQSLKFWIFLLIFAMVAGGLGRLYLDMKIQEAKDEIADFFAKPHIEGLMEQVVTEKAGNRITVVVDSVADARVENEVRPQLSEIGKQLVRSDSVLVELQTLSEFYGLAISVRSDNRKAFESIVKINNTPSDPRYHQARALVDNILRELDIFSNFKNPFDWKRFGKDPTVANISVFKDAMEQLRLRSRAYLQADVMDTAWQAQHLSKKERIQFLIDIMINTSSLRCLDKACRLLNEEAKIGANALAWKKYLRWWEINKKNYD